MDRENNPVDGREFNAYLSEKTGIPLEDFPTVGDWSGAGDTFGAIALKLNLISMSVIDTILAAQEKEPYRFGEMAVKLGIIKEEQAKRVLAIQRFHRSLETGERLVVYGKLELPKLLRLMADFLEEKD